MYGNITIEEAEEWCSIKNIAGLIDELNAALIKAETRA
jgi:hypothetical protein